MKINWFTFIEFLLVFIKSGDASELRLTTSDTNKDACKECGYFLVEDCAWNERIMCSGRCIATVKNV